jgi:FSR family fosmidomycin resistance protein-like MFS transporter
MRRFNLKILLILSLGHTVTDIFQGALPTVLPFLKDRLDLSYTVAGMILLAANITSSMIQPIFGFFSDKKKLIFFLFIGPLAAGIGLSLVSVPSAYFGVLMFVILSGFGIASFHPEGYKTASFFTGEKKVTGMAFFSVGGNLGFALGPMIAIYLIQYLGFTRLPLMSVIPVAYIVLLMVYWKNITARIPVMGKSAAFGTDYRLTREALVSLSLVVFVVVLRTSIQTGLMSYIPFYYINYLKGDPLYAGKLVFTLLMGGVVGTMSGAPLADRWGHKRFTVASMFLSSLVLPLIFVVKGGWLFPILGLLGFVTISSFPVTIVMGQQLLPHHLGIASGLMVGFAIGMGGLWVTILGVIADRFGVPVALQSIMILPVLGFIASMIIQYPLRCEKAALAVK